MLGQQGSLVKYSTPVLVSATGKSNLNKKKNKHEEPHHTEDILGQILPPKQHQTQNGQLWVQTVLSTPATKIEVIQLHEELDKRLNLKQAREVGLCPVRQELYEQCFDEIIRQITIDCRQRGLLLVRVRDEYRKEIKAYKNLYESSIGHGMRRVIDSEEKKSKLNAEIAKMDKECLELERNVGELTATIKNTKEQEVKKMREESEKHKKNVEEIKEANQKLKTEIQNALEKRK